MLQRRKLAIPDQTVSHVCFSVVPLSCVNTRGSFQDRLQGAGLQFFNVHCNFNWNLILAFSFCANNKKNWRRELQGDSNHSYISLTLFLSFSCFAFYFFWNFRSVNCMTWQIKFLLPFSLLVCSHIYLFHICPSL